MNDISQNTYHTRSMRSQFTRDLLHRYAKDLTQNASRAVYGANTQKLGTLQRKAFKLQFQKPVQFWRWKNSAFPHQCVSKISPGKLSQKILRRRDKRRMYFLTQRKSNEKFCQKLRIYGIKNLLGGRVEGTFTWRRVSPMEQESFKVTRQRQQCILIIWISKLYCTPNSKLHRSFLLLRKVC